MRGEIGRCNMRRDFFFPSFCSVLFYYELISLNIILDYLGWGVRSLFGQGAKS